MNNINRKIQPTYEAINTINITKSEKSFLDNNIPIHVINSGTQEIVKIDFVFKAGIYFQDKKVQASLTNAMLNEGSTKKSANDIAEIFDFHGAYFEFSIGHQESCISLFTLKKHLKNTLPLVVEILQHSNFPEKEFKIILNKRKQNYLISQEKSNILVRDKFNQVIYGINHPYANKLELSDFDKIKLQDIKDFFHNYYTINNCYIIASGKIDSETLQYINTTISENWTRTEKIINKIHNTEKEEQKNHKIIKKDAVQASIRIGRELFNKNHPDYIGMQLLNSILGGYFGSRLMQNIREEKGYTYDISSFVMSHSDTGHWAITTDVNIDLCEKTITEIYKEIKKLQTETVSANELNIVRNYISGEIIRELDNPFSLAESLKNNLTFNKDNSYYSDFLDRINKITPTEIQELAVKYLKKDQLYQIVSNKE